MIKNKQNYPALWLMTGLVVLMIMVKIGQYGLKKYRQYQAFQHSFHEPEPEMFQRVQDTHKQAQKLYAWTQKHAPQEQQTQVRTIISKLLRIIEQYEKAPAGFALLGPIGTTSIVLKEERLEKELLHLIQQLLLIADRTEEEQPYKPAESADARLKSLSELIDKLPG